MATTMRWWLSDDDDEYIFWGSGFNDNEQFWLFSPKFPGIRDTDNRYTAIRSLYIPAPLSNHSVNVL